MLYNLSSDNFTHWRIDRLARAMQRSVNKFWKKIRVLSGAFANSHLISIEDSVVIYKVVFGVKGQAESSVLYKINIEDIDNNLEPEKVVIEDE